MNYSEQIETKILMFLDSEDSKKDIDVLCDLAEEQWYTYEPLKENVKQQVEDYLKDKLDLESYEVVESVIFIIGHLGLEGTFDLLCNNKDNISSPIVRDLVEQAIAELKYSIKDPYISLR